MWSEEEQIVADLSTLLYLFKDPTTSKLSEEL